MQIEKANLHTPNTQNLHTPASRTIKEQTQKNQQKSKQLLPKNNQRPWLLPKKNPSSCENQVATIAGKLKGQTDTKKTP